MMKLIKEAGLENEIQVDSAGTIGHHAGEPADRRMREHALGRGIELTSISRKVRFPQDFEQFDLIIAMDDNNFRDLKSLDPEGKFKNKIVKMTQYCSKFNDTFVPDPYYGGASGFEKVLDLLEDACSGLLQELS